MNEVVKNLKDICISLYNSLEKDEDGYVMFGEDNILYLKEMFYQRCYLREVNGMKVDENGCIWLWEDKREDDFCMAVYDDSEYEILSKLQIVLMNV